MKYGYHSKEEKILREISEGKIGNMATNFMMDYYWALMKRKTLKDNERQMLKMFFEMVDEMKEHFKNI